MIIRTDPVILKECVASLPTLHKVYIYNSSYGDWV